MVVKIDKGSKVKKIKAIGIHWEIVKMKTPYELLL
jgi:hypothetical protein